MIISIDQSLVNSGVAIYFNNEIITDSIEPKSKGTDRLIEIQNRIIEFVLGYKVNLIIIEDYAHGARGHTFSLGELGGMIRLLARRLQKPLLIMPISTHKIYTTGKGNIKKDMMLKEVYKKYDIDVDDDNIADAISMLKTFLAYLKWIDGKLTNIPKARVRALDILDKIVRENSDINSFIRSYKQPEVACT